MLFGQRSQKRQEPIKVLLGQPAELLGDEFALAHILSISFYGSSGAPANISNFPENSASDGQEQACFQQLAIICESQFVRWGLSQFVDSFSLLFNSGAALGERRSNRRLAILPFFRARLVDAVDSPAPCYDFPDSRYEKGPRAMGSAG